MRGDELGSGFGGKVEVLEHAYLRQAVAEELGTTPEKNSNTPVE